MRRTLLLLVVLLVGCAKSNPSAESTPSTETATKAPITLAEVSGTWDGSVMTTDNDTVRATIELNATADPSTWSMKIANVNTPTKQVVVPARSVIAEGDSVIVEAGPFDSVLRPGQQVSTHTVYRLQDERLVGTIVATYPSSGQSVELRTEATRKATP